MATFKNDGMTGLLLTLEEIAEIPEEVVSDMLNSSADIAVKAMRQSLIEKQLVDTRQLLDSIKKRKPKKDKGGDHAIIVGPAGIRQRNGKAMKSTNTEVGFVHEFGAYRKGSRVPASQWMRLANEKCAPDVEAAQLAVYDAWLKSKNL